MLSPVQFPLCLLVLVSALTSTADAQPAGGPPRLFVYVSAGASNEIKQFRLNPATGALTAAGTTPIDGGPGALAVDPTQNFLYAAIRTTNSVATFRIAQDAGALTKLGVTPVVDNPVYLATDRTGRHLLTAYYSAGKAAVYPVGADGLVGGTATQVLTAEKNPHSIAADPSNQFVFVPNCGSDSILQYKLDSTSGVLVANDPPKAATHAGDGPRHFAFHPTRNLVYFVNEKSSSVSAYQLDQVRGTLAHSQTISTLPADFTGKNTCADIHVTPNGKFLYASNRGHDSIACFVIGEDHKLAPNGQQPTEKTPRAFAVDPTGHYLFAAGQASDQLAAYRIDATNGKLGPLAVYPAGKGPAWVTVLDLNRGAAK